MNYQGDYYKRIVGQKKAFRGALRPGDMVRFLYDGKHRLGFVIAPDFEGKLAVLSLRNIPFNVFEDMLVNQAVDKSLMIKNKDKGALSLYSEVKEYALRYNAYRTFNWSDVEALETIDIELS